MDIPPRRAPPRAGRWRLLLSLIAATALHLAIFAAVVSFVHRADVPSAISETAIALVLTPAPQADAPAEPSSAERTETASPAVEVPQPAESPPPDPPVPIPEPAPVPAPTLVPEPTPAPEATPLPVPPLSRPPEPRPTPVEAPPPKPAKRAKPASPSHAADVPSPARAPQPSAPSIGPAPSADAPVAADWQHSLAAWLAQHKNYPEIARRQGAQGGVVLRFTADRSGRVLDVELVRSAGSPILDNAAEAMLRDATVPPFSAGMAQDRITVTVQIRYALTN